MEPSLLANSDAEPTIDINLPFELASLRMAVEYQKWVRDAVSPYLGSRILEIGAGIGNMSQWLPMRELLVISEGNESFVPTLEKIRQQSFQNDPKCKTVHMLVDSPWVNSFKEYKFDTIVSFNVLEHIEDDAKAIADFSEVLSSSDKLRPRRIVSFIPAHPWLYGSMDVEFGHYRRYSAKVFHKMVSRVLPHAKVESRYFNILGVPGWLILGRLLRRKNIGISSIQAFEKLCPYVRGIDDYLHKKLRLPIGQSLLTVITLP